MGSSAIAQVPQGDRCEEVFPDGAAFLHLPM